MNMKCGFCRSVITKDNSDFLGYSKGDWFCRESCFKRIKGVRECLVCGDEFYYVNDNKKFCSGVSCSSRYFGLKKKISIGGYLSEDELKNKENWGL